MRLYFKIIQYTQEILLAVAIGIMLVLPVLVVFYPDNISAQVTQGLFTISHIFLFFVMMVRPLADLFTKTKWIRPLVILRKGAGVMSASIIVSFILAKLMIDPSGYIASMGTVRYWSLENYALLAHLADFSAIVLIVTSNNLSKRLLGVWWKRVQKLAYVYFYGSTLYVFLSYGNKDLLVAIILVTTVTLAAYVKNRKKRLAPKNI